MRRSPPLGPSLSAGLLSIGLAALLACGQGGVDPSTEHASGGGPLGQRDPSVADRPADPALLALMATAPVTTLYQGVRRYEHHSTAGGPPHSLIYREQVSCDGRGAYAIDPLELVEPQVSQGQQDLFLLLQRARTGLMFRYRDFRIHDLAAFAANYSAIDTGKSVQVVGRACAELQVALQQAPDRRWVLHVDSANGLVLRAREEALDGGLISLSEFESLSLAPDLSSVAFHQPQFGEQSLVAGSVAATQALGFAPSEPKLLPLGWGRIEHAKLIDSSDGNRPWAKFVYSDGVELLFYLQAKRDPPPPQVPPGQPGVPLEPDLVRSLAVGPWNLAQGRIHRGDLVVMGKVDETSLYDLIQSTF